MKLDKYLQYSKIFLVVSGILIKIELENYDQ